MIIALSGKAVTTNSVTVTTELVTTGIRQTCRTGSRDQVYVEKIQPAMFRFTKKVIADPLEVNVSFAYKIVNRGEIRIDGIG